MVPHKFRKRRRRVIHSRAAVNRLDDTKCSLFICVLRCVCLMMVQAVLAMFIIYLWVESKGYKHDVPLTTAKSYHCESSLKLDYEALLLSNNATDCTIERFLNASDTCFEELSTIDSSDKLEFSTAVDFRRVVLVVSFNKPNHVVKTISYIHRLYQGLFFKIIYCVTDMASVLRSSPKLANLVNVTVFEFNAKVSKITGTLFYRCTSIVYKNFVRKNNYRIDGILQVSDDLIVNLWSFKAKFFDLNRNWLPRHHVIYDIDSGRQCEGQSWDNRHDCKKEEEWKVWAIHRGLVIDAMDEIEQSFPKFAWNLATANIGQRRIRNNYADVYYLSRSSLPLASQLFEVFAKYNVYMELVVGTVIYGIDPYPLMIPKNGQLTGLKRLKAISETYSPRHFLYHPLKLSFFNQGWSLNDKCIYCQILLRMDMLRQRYTNICPNKS